MASKQSSPMPENVQWKLRSDLVYRFNAAIELVLSGLSGGENYKAVFSTQYYNGRTQTFNWMSVDKDILSKDPEGSGILQELNEEERCEILESVKGITEPNQKIEDTPDGEVYRKTLQVLRGISNETNHQSPLLPLYSGFQFHEETNAEGVLVRLLKLIGENSRCKSSLLSHVEATGLSLDDPNGLVDYLEVTEPCMGNSTDFPKYQNIRSCEPEQQLQELPDRQNNMSAQDRGSLQQIADIVFNLVAPKELRGAQLSESNLLILVPIFDVRLKSTARTNIQFCGGLKGVVICLFENEEGREKWKKFNLRLLQDRLSTAVSEIHQSLITQAVSVPIKPPYTLLRHFIDVLTYVQNWESVRVIDTDSWEIEFEYVRKGNRGSFVRGWRESMKMRGRYGGRFKPTKALHKGYRQWYMWWTKDLWDEAYIDGLDATNFEDLRRYVIRFQFPKACYIPTDKAQQAEMRNAYLRQQMELLRPLIQKVQVRRSALRSAVSAIMGRNMSHNIGSHVIARYAAIAGEMCEQRKAPLGRGMQDHRSDLLFYLQRRMDLLADISSSEKASYSQSVRLDQLLEAMNYEKQKDRISADACKYEPILLRHITGKDGLKATVELADELSGISVSIPGGEVGTHALYIILENVIRNSAKHNNSGSHKQIKLCITVDKCKSTPELLSVLISDRQTNNKNNGVSSDINEILGQQEGAEQRDRILDDSGSLDPRSWGVREMQICAHYLRGIALSDLEASPSKEERDYPPCLEALDDKDDLVYQLFLRKPKRCAIVAGKQIEGNADQINHGIKVAKGVEDILEPRQWDFMVVPRRGNSPADDAVRFPVRTLHLCDKEITELCIWSLKTSDDLGSFTAKLLDHYIATLAPENSNRAALVVWAGNGDDKHVVWARDGDDKPSNTFHIAHLNGKTLEGKLKELTCDGVVKPIVWLDHANAHHICTLRKLGYGNRYIETVDGITPHRLDLQNVTKWGPDSALAKELLASALADVVMLDERAQARSTRVYREGLEFGKLWSSMGIFVPDKNGESESVDLDNPSFCQIKGYLREKAQFLCKKGRRVHFLITHLSILETLAESSPAKDKADPQSHVISELRKAVNGKGSEQCELVVVTGRGDPTFFRIVESASASGVEYRHLPISSLWEYLVGRPSKLAFMRAIWSA